MTEATHIARSNQRFILRSISNWIRSRKVTIEELDAYLINELAKLDRADAIDAEAATNHARSSIDLG